MRRDRGSALDTVAASGIIGRYISRMLSADVPATEVAQRLGPSVAMLLKRYASRIDGQQTAANKRIARALGDGQV